MLKEMPKNEGAKGKGINQYNKDVQSQNSTTPPTYFELGIDKKDASKWQQMAENKKEIAD